jgi:hypothetical protein
MVVRKRAGLITALVLVAFLLALGFALIPNVWIPIGITCLIITFGCPIWDFKFSDGTHDFLIFPTALGIVGIFFSIVFAVEAVSDPPAKANSTPQVPKVVPSTLARTLESACHSHVAQLQTETYNGYTEFWLVVCKDGSVHRVNPADY